MMVVRKGMKLCLNWLVLRMEDFVGDENWVKLFLNRLVLKMEDAGEEENSMLFLLVSLFGYQQPKVKYSLRKLGLNNNTSFLSHGKNTALHLAARMGDKSVVEELLNLNTFFLTEKNIKGNTPLHLAACFGHVDIVESLIHHAKTLDVENGRVLLEVISMRNMNDDTPLHEAVRGGHFLVTSLLVEVVKANHSDLLASRNKAGESPFSMAIDVNHFRGIVRTILDAEPSCLQHRGPNHQTPLHRAILRAGLGTIKILLKKNPDLISEPDRHGRTPLHYAAASGTLPSVRHLLKVEASLALHQDHYQATPAHLAAESGREDVLRIFLNRCPHSVELLNQDSQNILHVAAQNGSINVVNYILRLEADDLINKPDKDGNTPLHLAVMNFHSSMVRALVRTNEVDIRATNEHGKTALDIAQDYKRNMTTKKSLFKVFQLREDNFENWSIQMKTLLDSKDVWDVIENGYKVPTDESNLSQAQRDHIRDVRKKDKQALSFIYQGIDENAFEKISRANTAKEAWEILEDSYKTVDKSPPQERAVLKAALDTSSDEKDDDDKIRENQFIIEILKKGYAEKAENLKDIPNRMKHPFHAIRDWKRRKELCGALMVMAILIATVTFAAAFTIPGGFRSGGPHEGMAVLGRNAAFRTFVITDTIAMTSSMLAALILITTPIWTDKEISDSLFGMTVFLLWMALMTMGIAFVTGLYAVLSEWSPLAIAVCCIGGFFPFVVYPGYLLFNDGQIPIIS